MGQISKPKAYIIGILFYEAVYAVLNVANTWYTVLLFGLLAVIAELTSMPIHLSERTKLIPNDKQASYMAFASFAFSGGDMLGRFGIILYAYLIVPAMAVYTVYVATLGAFLVCTAFFVEKQEGEGGMNVEAGA